MTETTLAAANLAIVLDKAKNLARILETVEAAADQAVDVLVIPEMALQGYADLTLDPASPEAAEQRLYFQRESETITGQSTARIAEAAARRNMLVQFGMAERGEDREKIYNTAVLVGPEGIVGSYRKIHNRFELPYFNAGDLTPLFRTSHGVLASTICYDLCFPELVRSYALRGAQLILNSTAWSTKGKQRSNDYYGRMLDLTAQSNAFYNQLWLVLSNQCGKKINASGANYHGGSQIIDPSGTVVAQIDNEEGLAVHRAGLQAEIARARSESFFRLNLLQDRRPEHYGGVSDGPCGRADIPLN